MDIPAITNEDIGEWEEDFASQIYQRQIDGLIAHQRAEVAAICDDYTAWMMYPPTPSDDPAEWAPYWTRLTDAVVDEDEREAIVASWWDRNGREI